MRTYNTKEEVIRYIQNYVPDDALIEVVIDISKPIDIINNTISYSSIITKQEEKMVITLDCRYFV